MKPAADLSTLNAVRRPPDDHTHITSRLHAWRYLQGRDVPPTPPPARARRLGPLVPCGDGQSGPLWPPAQRHGRRHLLAVESLCHRAIIAQRCGRGLHLCPGTDPRGARRLPRQLRQHELGRRPVRTGRGAGARRRRHRHSAHLQHQHPETDPRDVPLRDNKPRYDGDLVIPASPDPARRCGWTSLHQAVPPPAS